MSTASAHRATPPSPASGRQGDTHAPAARIRRKLWVNLALWGDYHIDLFESFSLPSLLAPGNLPALTANHDCTLLLQTRPSDRGRLRAILDRAPLPSGMMVEIDDTGFHDGGDSYSQVTNLHRRAIARAEDANAGLVFLMPDQVLDANALSTLSTLAAQGVRVVMVPSLRVRRDSFAEAYGDLQRASGDGAISARALMGLAFSHMHAVTQSLVWTSPEFSRHPSHIMWPAGPDSYLMRGFHLHPLMVIPKKHGTTFRITIDDDFISAACPDAADYHVVADSDEMVVVELSPPEKIVGNVGRNRASASGLASWAEFYANHIHRGFFSNAPIVLHAGPLHPDGLSRAHDIAMPVVHEVERQLALATRALIFQNFAAACQRALRHFLRDRAPGPVASTAAAASRFWLGALYTYARGRLIWHRAVHIAMQPFFQIEERALSLLPSSNDDGKAARVPGRRVVRMVVSPPESFRRRDIFYHLLRGLYSIAIGQPPTIRPWSLHWLRLRPFYRRLVRIAARRRIRVLHVGFSSAPCRLCFAIRQGAEIITMDTAGTDVDIPLPRDGSWPFSRNSFDMVVYTREEWSEAELEWALSECGRILRPGGEAVIGIAAGKSEPPSGPERLASAVQRVRRAASAARLDVIESDAYGTTAEAKTHERLKGLRHWLVIRRATLLSLVLLPVLPIAVSAMNLWAKIAPRRAPEVAEWLFLVARRRPLGAHDV